MSEADVGNAALELKKSTLESIEQAGAGLVARFSAHIHRSSGAAGVDAGTGWSQSAHFRLGRARVQGSVGSLPMELIGGSVSVSGRTFDNLVPMPLIGSGPVRVQLKGSRGLAVVLDGEDVEANLVGPAKYLEPFPGTGARKA